MGPGSEPDFNTVPWDDTHLRQEEVRSAAYNPGLLPDEEGYQSPDAQRRALVALVHLQEAIRNGAKWDESHYSAVEEIAGFIGGRP